jgi:LDH2 family malate/lactate/ureidoglycolate dehydrogenase
VSTHVKADALRRQLVSVLGAWGMSVSHAETTADVMVETDLRGVDSHGISMLPTYDREFRAGRLNMRPKFVTVREGAATALIDADASLGHPVSVDAMNLAVDKCLASGSRWSACATRIISGPPAAIPRSRRSGA